MNRRSKILALLSAICCLLIFALYPSFRLMASYSTQSDKDTSRGNASSFNDIKLFYNKKNAFATIICDSNMMEPTLVSIYSLNTAFTNKPSSKSDIVVLLPESIQIQKEYHEKLEKLGATVIKTSLTATTNKSLDGCEDALVNLWALLDYEKIIYFTSDIIFNHNVDDLFNYPAGSAMTSSVTTADQIDSNTRALLVLEPNPQSFELLLRRSIRSQLSTIEELLQQSNLIDYKLHLTKQELKNAVVVYSGPMRPWNFHSYRDNDWKKHYYPITFYKWRRLSTDVERFFNPHPEVKNATRQQTVCDTYLKSINNNIHHFPIQNKFSVMISTYNPERIEHLSLIIRHLLKSAMVHTVFVTWHNPNLKVPASLYNDLAADKDSGRVKVLEQSFDSLNNRFNPTSELKTEAVYIVDDDIFMDLEDLEFTFSVWQGRKDSVVGHFPRTHTYEPNTKKATYSVTGVAPYSIILTKSMFIRSDYLFSYTCLLEPKLHSDVDAQLNCEDLGFAMMASGISGAASTYVRTKKAMEDFGTEKGISTNNQHMPARGQCITDFITKYWHEKDPLFKSYDAVAPYIRPQIRHGKWDALEKTMHV